MDFVRCENSIISFSERKRRVEIANNNNDVFYYVKLDEFIKDSISADYFCRKGSEKRFLIIELKGCSVQHGVRQIISSSEYCRKLLDLHKASGLIVARGYPRFDSTIQKLIREYRKKFGGPIHIVCGTYRFQYEALHSLKGPHRV